MVPNPGSKHPLPNITQLVRQRNGARQSQIGRSRDSGRSLQHAFVRILQISSFFTGKKHSPYARQEEESSLDEGRRILLEKTVGIRLWQMMIFAARNKLENKKAFDNRRSSRRHSHDPRAAIMRDLIFDKFLITSGKQPLFKPIKSYFSRLI